MELDVKERDVLRRWLAKTRERVVGFCERCERCGAACGSACRAVSIRERALDTAVRQGWRPL
jgi:hypothetical protein